MKPKEFINEELAARVAIELAERAVSRAQQRYMGMVHALQKGKKIPGASQELKKTARTMKKSDVKDFAKTPHSGLPDKLNEKWGTETDVSASERGKYAGKTKSDLLKSYNALKKSGPHKEGSPEYGRMKELAFAIRAKSGWGEVE